jgi:amino acid adenylation domain-containing protein
MEPTSPRLLELLSEKSRIIPEKIALLCGDRKLTYLQLDELSSQVARQLRQLGVERQGSVAVCMSRGIDAVVALLAVLKAGAYFVPLDPGHPPHRLAFAVTQTQASVLLSDRPDVWSGLLQGVKVVAFNPSPSCGLLSSMAFPSVEGTDLAYVIYTSGSTGQPKGVMVEHASLAYHIAAVRELYGLRNSDRVLQLASLAFDASLESIFSAIAAGAQLVIVPGLLGPAELVDVVSRHGITVVELTPGHWAQLVDVLPSLNKSFLDSLRLLILGGDVVPAGTLEKFITAQPDITVMNTYGPTEATIACTAYKVPPNWRGSRVPIGFPSVPQKRVYVLDEQLKVAPDGEIGEICVAGPGLARGYLQDTALTSERFLTWGSPTEGLQERIYRTGDRGRKRADGVFEFIGRMDRQVKIRGMRAEPAEIESVLTRHISVVAAVVVPTGELAAQALTAYIQWASGARHSVDELRRFAQDYLPGYMLPTSWIPVISLPTTITGKIDVAALTRAEAADPAERLPAHDPGVPTDEEAAIIQIWREVLKLEEISPSDNFFYLGGNSLSAMQLTFSIADRFSVEVPLVTAFSYPTPRKMAQFIKELLSEENDPTFHGPVSVQSADTSQESNPSARG